MHQRFESPKTFVSAHSHRVVFELTMLAGISRRIYGMKNAVRQIEYREPLAMSRSLSIPETYRYPRFDRSTNMSDVVESRDQGGVPMRAKL